MCASHPESGPERPGLFLSEGAREKHNPYIEAVKARERRRLPVVLSREEVKAVLSELEKTYYLICALMYGGGLRVSETVRLRVKDLDFERGLITVFFRQGRQRPGKHKLFDEGGLST